MEEYHSHTVSIYGVSSKTDNVELEMSGSYSRLEEFRRALLRNLFSARHLLLWMTRQIIAVLQSSGNQNLLFPHFDRLSFKKLAASLHLGSISTSLTHAQKLTEKSSNLGVAKKKGKFPYTPVIHITTRRCFTTL